MVILQYAEHVCKMHDISKYLTPSLKKGDVYDQEYWTICYK